MGESAYFSAKISPHPMGAQVPVLLLHLGARTTHHHLLTTRFPHLALAHSKQNTHQATFSSWGETAPKPGMRGGQSKGTS
jgi:hypothetical protein